jgi:DinB family
MALTKPELLRILQHEIRVLVHLASKVELTMLDYRPMPKQRSLLELLQYLAIMPPIHLRAIQSGHFDMNLWRSTWGEQQAIAKTLELHQCRDAIAAHNALFGDVLNSLTEDDLRTEFAMFGSNSSRAAKLITLVVSHLAAYRMQLFLYLKACGLEHLNTLNLWAGVDPS